MKATWKTVLCGCWVGLVSHSVLHAQVFTNQADAFGITQYNWNGHFGAALSVADWNDDGWPDLTFGSSNGALRTYKNIEGTGFEMIPLPWSELNETKALIWADLDNDGDDDLFIQEISGRVGILHNMGQQGFEAMDIPFLANVVTEAAGASCADYDNDGDLDIHLARYVEDPVYEGAANRNVLLRNDGNFQFTDVSQTSGIDVYHRASFLGTWWDYNHDGHQDLFVINDKSFPNAVFENQGDGTFVDMAASLGADVNFDCMSFSLGDMNSDGLQDIFHTNTYFAGDGLGSKLLVQNASGGFTESAAQHNLAIDAFCWGAVWLDVDNDMDLDIYVAEHDGLQPYGLNHLYENNVVSDDTTLEDEGTFQPFGTDVFDLDYMNSHVVASADLDRNGWVDFVVHNVGNHKARIWMNGGFDNGYNSLTLGLVGTLSNPQGAGAVITVHTATSSQSKVVCLGENYLSQESEYKTFGLKTDVIDSVQVDWPSGLSEMFLPEEHGLEPGTWHVLTEGESLCASPQTEITTCDFPHPLPVPNSTAPFDLMWISNQGDTLSNGEAPIWFEGESTIWTRQALWQNTVTCTATYALDLDSLEADLNQDGHVSVVDLILVLEELGCSLDCTSDLDGDEVVGVTDLLSLLTQFGAGCIDL